MGKPVTPAADIALIKSLRQRGYSLPEISRETGRGKTTVYRYIQDVKVLPEFRAVLKAKQGGSIARSKRLWQEAILEARALISNVSDKEKLIALACLYWSEGCKGDLSFINSDPAMVRVFVDCLIVCGVKRDEVKFSIRVFDHISVNKAKAFWSEVLDIPQSSITYVDVLAGKKEGKLKYGMCRVRVAKGGKYFKLIMSMIDLLKSELIPAAVVQRIGRGFPKP